MIRWSIQVAILLMLLSVGFNAGLVSRQPRDLGEPAVEPNVPSGADLTVPSPKLEPREVVRIQVASLADCQVSPDALQQVYAFASPDNREVTGPLDRFAAMLLTPPYKPLVEQQQVIVGSQVVHDNLASVMVTAMDQRQGLRMFHFYLAKETEAPYAGCWMTYGVVADPAMKSIEPASPATTCI
ncbi:hypothetical protein [Aeoliella sp. SH292]|uniref:hypothetical protein n=1 Tax=Aeoliella sp. SH292 TaxID=3454464 RepID=UPI003F9CA306